jgi:hypothetical protein
LGKNVSGEKVDLRTNRTLPPSRHTAGIETLLDDLMFENQILLLHANGQSSHDEAEAFQAILKTATAKLRAMGI